MGLFDFFKKNSPERKPIDFSQLRVDMHSHFLPGLDDGAKNMDQTIAMLAKMESLGYEKVITTPHVMQDYYRNTSSGILEKCAEVQQVAKDLGLTIEIEAAAEYYADENFLSLISREDLLCFGNRYVLMEFGFSEAPSLDKQFFFELLAKGYQPVLAHFERYTYWHGDVEKAMEFRELGVHIQLNINSLSGHYGAGIRKQAEALVDQQLVDFIATDAHRIEHLLLLEKTAFLPYVHKLMELSLRNPDLRL